MKPISNICDTLHRQISVLIVQFSLRIPEKNLSNQSNDSNSCRKHLIEQEKTNRYTKDQLTKHHMKQPNLSQSGIVGNRNMNVNHVAVLIQGICAHNFVT